MPSIMLPPVADEPAPKRGWIAIGCGLLLILVIISLTTLNEKDPIPATFFNATTDGVSVADEVIGELIDRGKHVEAFQKVYPAARAGDAPSQRLIGTYMATGIDGAYQRDFCAAAEWLYKAAKGGEPRAQLLLSTLYLAGEGVQQSAAHGKYWFDVGVNSARKSGQDLTDFIDGVNSIDYDNFRGDGLIEPDNVPVELDGVRSYDDAPPLTTQSVPNIPIIGTLYGSLVANSVGCHAKSRAGFYEVFFTFRRERAQQRR